MKFATVNATVNAPVNATVNDTVNETLNGRGTSIHLFIATNCLQKHFISSVILKNMEQGL